MDNNLAIRIEFLQQFGIEKMGHSGQGLLNHLLGTREILAEWGARQALCDAGLFHSVYGTESYTGTTVPMSMRDLVREVIGEEAEELAYLFGVMRRKLFRENFELQHHFRIQHRQTNNWIPITSKQFSDLANLEIANALEQIPRLPSDKKGKAEFLKLYRSRAMPKAKQAIDKFFTEKAKVEEESKP